MDALMKPDDLPERARVDASRASHDDTSPGSYVDTVYFDGLYETTDDPWHMETRWYEARKRNLLCNVLPKPRYRRAFEPGCGAGLLTQALAPRCDAIVAGDLHDRAVQAARQRLIDSPHVDVQQLDIPHTWPQGQFDLIVISELGYYFKSDTWMDIARRLHAMLSSDGTLVACHWRHEFDARVTPTHFVHDALRTAGVFHSQCMHEEPDFLLEVWTRSPASIAQFEQLR